MTNRRRSAADAANLWPEPRHGTRTAASEDSVETKLENAVCNHTVTPDAARRAIAANGTTALSVTGIGRPAPGPTAPEPGPVGAPPGGWVGLA